MSSHPNPEPDGLPEDLAVLGERIEAAAQRSLARRRRLRRSLLNGLAVVLIGTPLAVGAAATDVAPSSGSVATIAQGMDSGLGVPGAGLALVLRNVPDGRSSGAPTRLCNRDQDCRSTGVLHMSYRRAPALYDSGASPDSSAG